MPSLARGDTDAGGIAARFSISRPAISRHLRVLREAGLVHAEPQGQRRVYTLERQPLADLRRWLEQLEPRVPPGPAGRLDALDSELRRGRRTRRTADQGDTDARSAG